jgi:hypothetical protein
MFTLPETSEHTNSCDGSPEVIAESDELYNEDPDSEGYDWDYLEYIFGN